MNFWAKLNNTWEQKELMDLGTFFRIAYLLVPLIIYYLMGDLVEVVLWMLIELLLRNNNAVIVELIVQNTGTIKAMIYGIGLIASYLLLSRMFKNEVVLKEKAEHTAISPKMIFLAIFVALVLSLGLNYLFNAIGLVKSSTNFQSVSDRQFDVNFYVGLFLYGVVSAFVEEVIFRGIIYNRLKRMFPIVLSIILTSVLFGIFHGNIVQGIYATIMGFVLCIFYEKSNKFIYPLVVHMVANIGVYVLSYIVWK